MILWDNYLYLTRGNENTKGLYNLSKIKWRSLRTSIGGILITECLTASLLTHKAQATQGSHTTTCSLCLRRASTRVPSPELSLGVLQASRAFAPLQRAPWEGRKSTGSSGLYRTCLTPVTSPTAISPEHKNKELLLCPQQNQRVALTLLVNSRVCTPQALGPDQWNSSAWPPRGFKHQQHLNASPGVPCPRVPHTTCDQ